MKTFEKFNSILTEAKNSMTVKLDKSIMLQYNNKVEYMGQEYEVFDFVSKQHVRLADSKGVIKHELPKQEIESAFKKRKFKFLSSR